MNNKVKFYKIYLEKIDNFEGIVGNVEVGWNFEFDIREQDFYPPKVGERFKPSTWWSTSGVKKIINSNTFQTHNSIYKWEMVSEYEVDEAEYYKKLMVLS